MEEALEFFDKHFLKFYNQLVVDLEGLYENKEPMVRIRTAQCGEIKSILHSSSYLNNKSIFLTASYVTVSIATRQILHNGNKRLSLIVAFFLLAFWQYELKLEKKMFGNIIKDLVLEWEKTPDDKRHIRFHEFVIAIEGVYHEFSLPLINEIENLDMTKTNIKGYFQQD